MSEQRRASFELKDASMGALDIGEIAVGCLVEWDSTRNAYRIWDEGDIVGSIWDEDAVQGALLHFQLRFTGSKAGPDGLGDGSMSDMDPSDSYDRCLCGHFRDEHDGRCHGAYGTLTLDADDASVEVHCPCDNFYKVEANYHEVRG